MGYDRWMLSPISQREASQDNEESVGEGGFGEVTRWTMPVWLKKAPECIFCSCEKSCSAGKGISIYISTGFQVRKIQSELRLSFYSTTYHSSPICPHSTSTFSLFLFCHSWAKEMKWKIFLGLTRCCVKVPTRMRQEF